MPHSAESVFLLDNAKLNIFLSDRKIYFCLELINYNTEYHKSQERADFFLQSPSRFREQQRSSRHLTFLRGCRSLLDLAAGWPR
jgi:hypothetical protein